VADPLFSTLECRPGHGLVPAPQRMPQLLVQPISQREVG
jgi:hypothetical protein